MVTAKIILLLFAVMIVSPFLTTDVYALNGTITVNGYIVGQQTTITTNAFDSNGVSSINMVVTNTPSSITRTCTISPPTVFASCVISTNQLVLGQHTATATLTNTLSQTMTISNIFNMITQPDTISPVIFNLTHLPVNPQPNQQITFTAIATDNVAVFKFELYVDSQLVHTQMVSPPTSPVTLTYQHSGLPMGPHSYYIKVYDTANNIVVSQVKTLNIGTPETVAPTLTTSVSPGVNVVTGKGITFTATATDSSAVKQMYIEGRYQGGVQVFNKQCPISPPGSPASCSTRLFFPTPRTFNFNANAHDVWNNFVTSTPILVTVVADTVLPSGTITHSPVSPSAGQTITFTANSQDNPGTNQIAGDVIQTDIFVDGNHVHSCQPSPTSANPPPCTYTTTLSQGTHTYKMRVWDGALNQWTSSQQTFTVGADAQPPVIIHSYSLSGQTVTITATVTDNVGVSGIYVYIDSNLVKTCTHSPAVPNPPSCVYTGSVTPGPHTYEVIALDPSNNQARTGLVSFTTDTIPPLVTLVITSTAPGIGFPDPSVFPYPVVPTSSTLKFMAIATDNVALSSIDVVVGGATVKTCTTSPCSHSMKLKTVGLYAAYADAYDTSNNKATTSVQQFHMANWNSPPPPPPSKVNVPIPNPPPITPPGFGTSVCTCHERACSKLGTVVSSPPTNCAGWCTVLGNKKGLTCDAYVATPIAVSGQNKYSCKCDTSLCQNIPPVTLSNLAFSVQCMNYCATQTINLNLQAQGSFCI